MPEPASPPIALHTREVGKGPAVLLVHGLAGDHTIWGEVVPRLAAEFRVLSVDLRGHGGSSLPPNSTFSFAELEADVLQVLDDRGIDAAHMVAFSAGGFLALRLALDHPERLRSLVLIGAAVHCDAHARAVGENWAEVRDREGKEALVLRLLKDLYYPDWVEAHMDVVDRLRDYISKPDDFVGPERWAVHVKTFDLRGRLGRLRTPTLIIQGMDDRIIDSSHARLLRQSITGAELRLLPNTAHMVPIERGEELGKILHDRLGALEGTKSQGSE